MTHFWAASVYALCLIGSSLCTWLLLRAWRQVRTQLLLWTAIGFGFLALNNLALVADMVVFPDLYLWPFRAASTLVALCLLLYGFIWESER
jgi:hypothetical protein